MIRSVRQPPQGIRDAVLEFAEEQGCAKPELTPDGALILRGTVRTRLLRHARPIPCGPHYRIDMCCSTDEEYVHSGVTTLSATMRLTWGGLLIKYGGPIIGFLVFASLGILTAALVTKAETWHGAIAGAVPLGVGCVLFYVLYVWGNVMGTFESEFPTRLWDAIESKSSRRISTVEDTTPGTRARAPLVGAEYMLLYGAITAILLSLFVTVGSSFVLTALTAVGLAWSFDFGRRLPIVNRVRYREIATGTLFVFAVSGPAWLWFTLPPREPEIVRGGLIASDGTFGYSRSMPRRDTWDEHTRGMIPAAAVLVLASMCLPFLRSGDESLRKSYSELRSLDSPALLRQLMDGGNEKALRRMALIHIGLQIGGWIVIAVAITGLAVRVATPAPPPRSSKLEVDRMGNGVSLTIDREHRPELTVLGMAGVGISVALLFLPSLLSVWGCLRHWSPRRRTCAEVFVPDDLTHLPAIRRDLLAVSASLGGAEVRLACVNLELSEPSASYARGAFGRWTIYVNTMLLVKAMVGHDVPLRFLLLHEAEHMRRHRERWRWRLLRFLCPVAFVSAEVLLAQRSVEEEFACDLAAAEGLDEPRLVAEAVTYLDECISMGRPFHGCHDLAALRVGVLEAHRASVFGTWYYTPSPQERAGRLTKRASVSNPDVLWASR